MPAKTTSRPSCNFRRSRVQSPIRHLTTNGRRVTDRSGAFNRASADAPARLSAPVHTPSKSITIKGNNDLPRRFRFASRADLYYATRVYNSRGSHGPESSRVARDERRRNVREFSTTLVRFGPRRARRSQGIRSEAARSDAPPPARISIRGPRHPSRPLRPPAELKNAPRVSDMIV